MQRGAEGCLIGQIDLKMAEQSYSVPGFSEAYATHLEGRAGDQVFYGRLLIFISSVVAALGLGIAIFGPEVIYYDRFSGLTLIQHVQLNPGLISIAGGLMIAWGGKQRNEGIVHREDFLLSHYKFVAGNGRDVSNQVNVRHLGGDDFSVSVAL